MGKDKFIQIVRDTLEAERQAIDSNLQNPDFLQTVVAAAFLLKGTSNRIITTGMGKSGLIARKVAATLTSTGSPAVFIHPADALHGDIGNIQPREVVLAFSNSGETRELIELLPFIRLLEGKVVAVTRGADSHLAKEADAAIIYQIEKEGCPLNLAPMASTTISLAIGDALSAALIAIKKFKASDFGRFHPSGSLGKKLTTRVKDVMSSDVQVTVAKSDDFRQVLSVMISSNMGAVLVTGSRGHLRGIVTDGDLKRLFEHYEKQPAELWKHSAAEIMTANPVMVRPEMLVEEAVSLMQQKNIYILPVVDAQKKPLGVVRMHDLVDFL